MTGVRRAIRGRRGVGPAGGILAVLSLVAAAPAPFLFVCACKCTTGGPVPTAVAETPWQPLLLLVGLAGYVVFRRRRGGSPPSSGEGGDGGGTPVTKRHSWRLGLAVARVAALVALTSVSIGAASAVVAAAAPQAAATAVPCDCKTPSSTAGDVAAAVDAPVPNAGGESPLLTIGLPLLAGGVAVAGGALLLRPRRRSDLS